MKIPNKETIMDNYELTQNFTDLLNDNKKNHQYKELKETKANYSDCLIIKFSVGGAQGGNCWNDNPASGYSDDIEEIRESLEENIESALKYSLNVGFLNPSEEKINTVVKMLAKEYEYGEFDNDTEYEYYGNYTTYNLYAIPLKEILSPLMNAEQKEVFDQVHTQFMQESDKSFQRSKIQKEHSAMEAALKTFDEQKAQQKSNMCKQLASIQAQLAEFDKKTYAEKTKMKKQFEELTKQLDQFEPEVVAPKKKNKKK